MTRPPSYAASLAKDRDKYLLQRNRLAAHLAGLLDAYSGSDPAADAPIIQSARDALRKIYGAEKSAEEMLGMTK